MLLALFLGIYVPKSTASVEKQLSSLRASDKTYIEKKSEYDALVSEEEQLSSHIEQTNDELEKFEKTQDNLDKLSQKNIQLQSEKEQLQNEIASKQSKLSSLESSVNAYSRSSVTWSSGKYTVGTNIAAGTYIITGTGSIAISNSGTARVNKSLKSDGEVFTLNDGDIIKIDGNAKLVSE
jgi:predicted nuclease with TOPRIM domain